MPAFQSDDVREAIRVIASPPGDPQQLYELAERLNESNRIGYARKVLQKADLSGLPSGDRLRIDIVRKLSLYTYKDQDQPVDTRLNAAQAMLEKLLQEIPESLIELKQDTWGLLGAVHQQRWAFYGHREHLEKSRHCYEEGYKLGIHLQFGPYTALNAAFVLDLLAESGGPGESVEVLRRTAEQIRRNVIETLLPQTAAPNFQGDYWFLCMLGEAFLGTGRYAEAKDWMQKASVLQPQDWQVETTARKIAHLARLQARKEGRGPDQLDASETWLVVEALLGGDAVAAHSFFRGKVGLALSGGGFRASLYHIGVLAKLAELDMLRHVEVISCVSGGSILGAYYYLELQKLLESRADRDITRRDYIELVQRVERHFLAGVQRNLRNRMLAGFRSNWKVLTSRYSSTTHRLGDLYEHELYARVEDGKGKSKRFINDLIIKPPGTASFYPKYDNWRRAAKAPILVLNATTLNTCHNWQFTATFMGEPPARGIDSAIDANDRLRRMYYTEAPEGYRQVRLGYAVAASACVPGLFDPLVLENLYEQGYVTRLVDGGVFDNQGVASLTEQDCTVLLVSDASGQTGVVKEPAGSRLGAPLRSNTILMGRVRQTEYQLLASLQDASLLRGLMYVHLKKGLEAEPVDWIGCGDPAKPVPPDPLTSYGIRRDVQKLLADVRTDLDSFSDAEADALMLSGYRMTESEFARSIQGFPPAPPLEAPCWRFLRIASVAESAGDSPELEALKATLQVARYEAFKAFRLLTGFKLAAGAVGLLALAAVIWFFRNFWTVPIFQLHPTAAGVAGLAALTLLAAAAKYGIERWAGYRNSLAQVVGAVLMCTVGWLFLWVHLHCIDRFYLRWGSSYRRAICSPPPP